jgi:thiol-disulfide isomerase/thioredoxin
MTSFYDGKVRGLCNWEEQYVRVDSFQNHPYPFRLVAHYPFYVKTNEIIKYSLTTEDSIKTEFTDYGDSIHFRLKIYKHVYFHTKPVVIKNDYIPDDEISQFDIWFLRSNDLPYRMRSNWHHVTMWESCYNAEFNTSDATKFSAADYFPDYFEIVQFNRQPYKPKNDLTGKMAPEWTLRDFESNEVSLADLKSKVLLIQFTGVGCGPCHRSLPFLKKLVEDYKTRDFDFVSIEPWSKNIEGLKRYYQKNDLNYKFLKSEEEVSAAYEVTAVPTFFILDENRVIRKVISGYGEGSTDKKILEAIDELL